MSELQSSLEWGNVRPRAARVWNSWLSGRASCSFVLNPLASWDTTDMSGWGGVVQYVRRAANRRRQGDGFSLFRVGGWCGVVGVAVWPTWPKLEENWDGGWGDILFVLLYNDCLNLEITFWNLEDVVCFFWGGDLLNNSVYPFTSLIEWGSLMNNL